MEMIYALKKYFVINKDPIIETTTLVVGVGGAGGLARSCVNGQDQSSGGAHHHFYLEHWPRCRWVNKLTTPSPKSYQNDSCIISSRGPLPRLCHGIVFIIIVCL